MGRGLSGICCLVSAHAFVKRVFWWRLRRQGRNTKLLFPARLTQWETVWWGAEVVGGTQRVLNPALGDKFSIRSKEFLWSVDLGWCLRARLVEIHLVLSWTPNSISPTVKPSLRWWGLDRPTIINPKIQIPRFPLLPETPSPQLCSFHLTALKMLIGRDFYLSHDVRAMEGGSCVSWGHRWAWNYAKKACPSQNSRCIRLFHPDAFLIMFSSFDWWIEREFLALLMT